MYIPCANPLTETSAFHGHGPTQVPLLDGKFNLGVGLKDSLLRQYQSNAQVSSE